MPPPIPHFRNPVHACLLDPSSSPTSACRLSRCSCVLLPLTTCYCLSPPATASHRLLWPITTHYCCCPAPPKVRQSSTQLIVLGSFSGWGVNGTLVTLRPDTALPLPSPSRGASPSFPPPSASSSGLSSGGVAGIVVGSVAGGALLLAGFTLLLLRQRYLGG